MTYSVGDWVVYEMKIGQIKKLDDEGYASFSDGFCETSGRLLDRFRPLTLRNKRIVESFDIYYGRLREIDGEVGFNYPDISRHFARLALEAIDGDDENHKPFDKAQEFVSEARNYTRQIQGVALFRRSLRAG